MNLNLKEEWDNWTNLQPLQQVKERFAAGINFRKRDGRTVNLKFNSKVSQKYNIKFLEQIVVDKKIATVIGYDDENLWFILDGEDEVSFYPNLHGDIKEHFKNRLSKSVESKYPDSILRILNNNQMDVQQIPLLQKIINGEHKPPFNFSKFIKMRDDLTYRGVSFYERDSNLKLKFNKEISEKYHVKFLEQFEVDSRIATFIGSSDEFLWFSLTGDSGVTLWPRLKNNIGEFDEAKFTPTSTIESNYPKHLFEFFKKNYEISETEIKYLSEFVNNIISPPPNDILKFFTNTDRELFIGSTNSEIDLENAFIKSPTTFLNDLEKIFTSTNDYTASQNVINSSDTYQLNEDFEMQLELINLLINNVKDFKIDFRKISQDFFIIYTQMQKIIGEFIYTQEIVENKKDKFTFALMYFILAGKGNDIEILKNSCYLQLLDLDKMNPRNYDPVTFCENNPEKFIEAHSKILENIHELRSTASYHPYLILEEIRLRYFMSKAYRKTGNDTMADAMTILIETSMTILFKTTPEIGVTFAEQYLQDSFNINIKLAEYHFSNGKENEWEKYLNRASKADKPYYWFHHSFAIEYIFLLLRSKNKNYKLGIQYLKEFCLRNPSYFYIGYDFEKEAKLNSEIYLALVQMSLMCAMDPAVDSKTNNIFFDRAKEYINLYIESHPNNADAIYLKHIIFTQLFNFDFKSLALSARLGSQIALRKLHSTDNKMALCELGMMYLEGVGVSVDYILAEHYLIQSNTHEAILELAKMHLGYKIKKTAENDYNILNKLNSLIISESASEETRQTALNFVINFSEHHPMYRPDALLIMAENEKNNLQLASSYYAEFHKLRPNDIFPFLMVIQSSSILTHFNNKLIYSLTNKIFETKTDHVSERVLQKLANAIKERKNVDLTALLFQFPKLHQQINDQELVLILNDNKSTLSVDLLVNCIITRKSPQIILDWLDKNPDFIPKILMDLFLMNQLDSVPEWKEFFKTYPVQKTVNTCAFFTSAPKLVYLPHHFWLHKVDTETVKENVKKEQELCIQMKLKVFMELHAKKVELQAIDSSDQSNKDNGTNSIKQRLSFFSELSDELNTVKTREMLKEVVEDIAEIDPDLYKKLTVTMHSS